MNFRHCNQLRPETNGATAFVRHGVELWVIPGIGHFGMQEGADGVNAELQQVVSALQ